MNHIKTFQTMKKKKKLIRRESLISSINFRKLKNLATNQVLATNLVLPTNRVLATNRVFEANLMMHCK